MCIDLVYDDVYASNLGRGGWGLGGNCSVYINIIYDGLDMWRICVVARELCKILRHCPEV